MNIGVHYAPLWQMQPTNPADLCSQEICRWESSKFFWSSRKGAPLLLKACAALSWISAVLEWGCCHCWMCLLFVSLSSLSVTWSRWLDCSTLDQVQSDNLRSHQLHKTTNSLHRCDFSKSHHHTALGCTHPTTVAHTCCHHRWACTFVWDHSPCMTTSQIFVMWLISRWVGSPSSPSTGWSAEGHWKNVLMQQLHPRCDCCPCGSEISPTEQTVFVMFFGCGTESYVMSVTTHVFHNKASSIPSPWDLCRVLHIHFF